MPPSSRSGAPKSTSQTSTPQRAERRDRADVGRDVVDLGRDHQRRHEQQRRAAGRDRPSSARSGAAGSLLLVDDLERRAVRRGQPTGARDLERVLPREPEPPQPLRPRDLAPPAAGHSACIASRTVRPLAHRGEYRPDLPRSPRARRVRGASRGVGLCPSVRRPGHLVNEGETRPGERCRGVLQELLRARCRNVLR